jgi:hypothetical protein
MEWAKTHSAARFNLASSGVVAFPLEELGARIEDLEICGPSAYGYAPLQERLARKAGVDPDRVVHATGTSMANLLVLAAAAEPATSCSSRSRPTRCRGRGPWLRLDVRRFRGAEEGFRLDPARWSDLTPDAAHRPDEPPQPLERLRPAGGPARGGGGRALGRRPRSRGRGVPRDTRGPGAAHGLGGAPRARVRGDVQPDEGLRAVRPEVRVGGRGPDLAH